MKKLLLLACLTAMATAQEVSPAEFTTKEYLSVSLTAYITEKPMEAEQRIDIKIKHSESYTAQETQIQPMRQILQAQHTAQVQIFHQMPQPSTIQGGPGYEVAQRAAQEGRPITVRDGYIMWTTRIVEKDARGCTRVEVAKINLAAPPGVRSVPETWTYTFCQGQLESIGKPKYFQIPPQAKEIGQQIAGFCQRYGFATGKWNDIEINCRALRDKDQCLVEITYFDVINRAFVGSETVNGCR